MNLPVLINQALAANTTLASLIGSKFYHPVAPMGTGERYVVWFEVVSTPENTHEGPVTLENSLYQFSCYAESPSMARQLRSLVRSSLERVALAPDVVGVVRSSRSLVEGTTVPYRYRCDIDISFLGAPSA